MRILFLSSTFIDREGDDDFIFEFVRAFKEKGHQVSVLASHGKGLPKQQTIGGIKVKRFRYAWPASMQRFAYGAGIAQNLQHSIFVKALALPYVLFGAVASAREIKKTKPDIVVALWAFPQGFIAALLRKLMRFKLAIHLFGAEVYLAKTFHMPFLVKMPAQNSDVITANSNATKKHAVRLGIKKEISVVYCGGVNTGRFNQKNKGNAVRKTHGLGNSKAILTVGRLVERKGHLFLIKAMPLIIKKFPDAKLLIVGSGPLTEKLREEANRLGLQNSVILTGRVATETLPSYYAACDVFCLPAIVDSRGETEGGQGLVVLEAMATGKPVVASAIGGITDAVRHNVNGLLVKQRNERQLADAICSILGSEKLRQRLVENGLRFIKEEMSYARCAEKFLELFEKAV